MYPGECYYCAYALWSVQERGAITLEHPLMNQAKFVPIKNNVIYKESAEWILNISHSALL